MITAFIIAVLYVQPCNQSNCDLDEVQDEVEQVMENEDTQ